MFKQIVPMLLQCFLEEKFCTKKNLFAYQYVDLFLLFIRLFIYLIFFDSSFEHNDSL